MVAERSEETSEPESGPTTNDGAADSKRLDIEALGDATNVLVLEPFDRSSDDELCRSFFDVEGLADANVLLISIDRSVDDCVEMFYGDGVQFPRNLAVVSTEDRARWSRTETGSGDSTNTVTVKSVSDASELPKLGMSITSIIEEWPTDEEMLVCFDSLTTLLQYVELQRAYQFVHILNDRIASYDARVHFHMNSEAHDEQTFLTLQTLFDAVAEPPAEVKFT